MISLSEQLSLAGRASFACVYTVSHALLSVAITEPIFFERIATLDQHHRRPKENGYYLLLLKIENERLIRTSK